MKLIGIVGPKNVGKDTVADYLCSKHGYRKLAFASPIKRVCELMFGLDSVYFDDPDLKEQLVPEWNMTPRQLMQKVGTDVAQTAFGQDIWIKALDKRLNTIVRGLNAEGLEPKVVVSDVRFVQESMYIKSRGGLLVNVTCSSDDSDKTHDTHASETQHLVINCDTEIENNKEDGLPTLFKKVDALLETRAFVETRVL